MFYNYVNGFLTVHNINRKSIQKYAEVQFLKTYLQKYLQIVYVYVLKFIKMSGTKITVWGWFVMIGDSIK